MNLFLFTTYKKYKFIILKMRNNQIQCPTGSHQPQPPLPSQGGNAYSQEICHGIIYCYLSWQSLITPDIEDLRAQKLYMCLQTCNKWTFQFLSARHVNQNIPQGIILQFAR